jgi:hypothetical protein
VPVNVITPGIEELTADEPTANEFELDNTDENV